MENTKYLLSERMLRSVFATLLSYGRLNGFSPELTKELDQKAIEQQILFINYFKVKENESETTRKESEYQ